MRGFRRGLTAIIGLGIGVSLAGCGSWDPSDWLNTKKPLPGERHLVFPEGVPGVEKGVPKELVKGNQPANTDNASLIGVGSSEPATSAAPAPAYTPSTTTASAESENGQKLVGTPKPWTGKPPRSRTKVAVRPKPSKAKEPKAPGSVQPAEAMVPAPSGGAPTRITVAPTKPSNQANAKSGTLPSNQSAADAAIWGPTPGQTQAKTPAPAAAGTNAASAAPWPAAKPQQTSNAPWPDAPPANQFSR